jgi:hypothetical protein
MRAAVHAVRRLRRAALSWRIRPEELDGLAAGELTTDGISGERRLRHT